MGNNRNQSRNHITGNNNILGDNNLVNSRTESHFHQHNHRNSSPDTSENDAKAITGGLAVTLLVGVWMFVKHASEIYYYLHLALLISLVPFIAMTIAAFLNPPPERKHIVALFFGAALSATALFLIQNAQGQLDPELLSLSQNAKDAWSFWSGLTQYGRDLVIGNMFGAALIAVSLCFNFLMGWFVFFHYLQDNYFSELLVRMLAPFRPNRGGILSTLSLLIAWSFSSGTIFQLLR